MVRHLLSYLVSQGWETDLRAHGLQLLHNRRIYILVIHIQLILYMHPKLYTIISIITIYISITIISIITICITISICITIMIMSMISCIISTLQLVDELGSMSCVYDILPICQLFHLFFIPVYAHFLSLLLSLFLLIFVFIFAVTLTIIIISHTIYYFYYIIYYIVCYYLIMHIKVCQTYLLQYIY